MLDARLDAGSLKVLRSYRARPQRDEFAVVNRGTTTKISVPQLLACRRLHR